VTDDVYCLVKIIQKDERIVAAVQFEIKLFDFLYQSKRLTDYVYFIRTYTVNYQNALDLSCFLLLTFLSKVVEYCGRSLPHVRMCCGLCI